MREKARSRELLAAGAGMALGAVLILVLERWVAGDAAAPARMPLLAPTSSALAAASASDESAPAWQAANANLAQQVKEAQRRLEQNEAEKKVLERALEEAQSKLAASQGDGAPPRNEFDLTQEDWKELARLHDVKARYPCGLGGDWHIGPGQQTRLGLSPQEAAEVERAYLDEEDRLASVTQSGCAKVLGSAELARRLGNRVCESVLMNSQKDPNPDIQLVADVRAGNVPMPPQGAIDPYAAMLFAQTESMNRLQAALAPTLGPEDAHRVVFSDVLGSCSGTSGPPPPKR